MVKHWHAMPVTIQMLRDVRKHNHWAYCQDLIAGRFARIIHSGQAASQLPYYRGFTDILRLMGGRGEVSPDRD